MNEIPNINSNVINSNIINSNVINNASVNTNIPNNASEVQNVGILGGPRIISTIDPPVVQSAQQSLIRSLEKPIIRGADTSIKYPTLDVPTQEAFNAAVNAERKKQQKEEEEEKSRKLSDTPPIPNIPQIIIRQTPPSNVVTGTDTPPTQLGAEVNQTVMGEIQVPILGKVPIPTNKEVALAGTTAMAATAAALLGKSAVEFLLKFFKPIANQFWVRGKKLLNRDLTPYELQIYFAFQKEDKLKKVTKLLAKEKKAEKLRQFKKFYNKE